MKKEHMTTIQECSTASNTKESICPVCHNTGWELIVDGGQEIARECKCGWRQRQIMKGKLEFANLPKFYCGMRLDAFRTTIYREQNSRTVAEGALKAVRYWLDNLDEMKERGMGLFFFSRTKGSGKTSLMAAIANELLYEKKVQVKFATSLQILNEIKASWNRENNYTESKLLNDLSGTEMLIIDDFGTEQEKGWINDRFYQIINNRYISKKVTLFTSNESIEKLQYDERITNRIKERTFCIPFPEESVRNLIAEDNMGELVEGMKQV